MQQQLLESLTKQSYQAEMQVDQILESQQAWLNELDRIEKELDECAPESSLDRDISGTYRDNNFMSLQMLSEEMAKCDALISEYTKQQQKKEQAQREILNQEENPT